MISNPREKYICIFCFKIIIIWWIWNSAFLNSFHSSGICWVWESHFFSDWLSDNCMQFICNHSHLIVLWDNVKNFPWNSSSWFQWLLLLLQMDPSTSTSQKLFFPLKTCNFMAGNNILKPTVELPSSAFD